MAYQFDFGEVLLNALERQQQIKERRAELEKQYELGKQKLDIDKQAVEGTLKTSETTAFLSNYMPEQEALALLKTAGINVGAPNFNAADFPLRDFVAKNKQLESSGGKVLTNPRSSASGAHGFIDKTWLDLMKRYKPDLTRGKSDEEIIALKLDPQLGETLSDELASIYALENARALMLSGIKPDSTSLRLAHFFGPQGAIKFMENVQTSPDTKFEEHPEFQKLVSVNPKLQGKTFKQFYDETQEQMRDVPVGDVPVMDQLPSTEGSDLVRQLGLRHISPQGRYIRSNLLDNLINALAFKRYNQALDLERLAKAKDLQQKAATLQRAQDKMEAAGKALELIKSQMRNLPDVAELEDVTSDDIADVSPGKFSAFISAMAPGPQGGLSSRKERYEKRKRITYERPGLTGGGKGGMLGYLESLNDLLSGRFTTEVDGKKVQLTPSDVLQIPVTRELGPLFLNMIDRAQDYLIELLDNPDTYNLTKTDLETLRELRSYIRNIAPSLPPAKSQEGG